MKDYSKKTEKIYLKIKQLLENFGPIHFDLLLFKSEKAGAEERKELRKKLIEQIKKQKNFQPKAKKLKPSCCERFTQKQELLPWDSLLKIGSKPEGPLVHISISHSYNLGVFLFVFDKKKSIGFDIEQKDRITKKLISRISSKKEIKQAPFPQLLWVSKEAGLKGLSDNKKPLLLSDCFISNWSQSKKIYFFECHSKKTKKKALGASCFVDNIALAYTETII